MGQQQTNSSKLLPRSFVPVGPPQNDPQVSNSPQITLAQFNVLADHLSNDFPHTDTNVLKWDFRKNNLISVILAPLPDVLALEECDHFSDWFQPNLEKNGYEGIFYPKTYNPPIPQPDGTALFWRKDKFQLLKQSYSQYGDDTQGIVLALLDYHSQPGKSLCVAATHLKAKIGFEQKREIQGKLLLQAINNFIPDKECPVIILGDFNDVPNSPVYKVMSEYYTSAYDHSVPGHWTTWKKRKEEEKRTIDYIWYCPGKLRVTHVLEIPKDKDCPVLLPAEYYPSDHILVAAKFCL